MTMNPSDFFEEIQGSKGDAVILRKLIHFASSNNRKTGVHDNLEQWQNILACILDILTSSAEVERKQMLLASHAFFALLSTQSTHAQLKRIIVKLLQFHGSELSILDKKYTIADPESFKLTCAYGYLQTNHEQIYSRDLCLIVFNVIYENSIRYTKHSYIAYRVLHLWLSRTLKTDLWIREDAMLEGQLERIIFSNWSNAINEISKQNSGAIFNIYLRIMSAKYDGFLLYIFSNCLTNISWQNEIKYTILAEICEIWHKNAIIMSQDFLLSLSTALTKNYLRCPGTKLYVAIMKKLSEEEWISSFGKVVIHLFHTWEPVETAENAESERNDNKNALQFLCNNWLESTVKRHRKILSYIWQEAESLNGFFVKSHLQRMASEMRIELPDEVDINLLLNHKDEVIRLNGFSICCNRMHDSMKLQDSILRIQDFLWHNANTTSVYMREGIQKYFKIFFVNLLKACDTKPDTVQNVYRTTHWLHEFFMDCLEIGSCYQRKILGLILLKAMLSFTNGSALNKCNNAESTHCSMLLEKHFIVTGNWSLTNKKSLLLLLRLVLDSSSDAKQLATSIILDFFEESVLSGAEKRVLYDVALEHCNSSKFYQIESGATLFSLLATWLPLSSYEFTNDRFSTYSEFLYHEVVEQLAVMKEDMLKAIVQNKPFYGALAALLKVAFQNGPEKPHLSLEFAENILVLSRDATEFFLSVLSSKSNSTVFSSSFAEMGLAINEAIKTSEVDDDSNCDELKLSAAHQVLLSCIWMSLKVSCDIASEIGKLMLSRETVEQSASIIATVLFRCRHKGVVESAGAAIGSLSKVLCREAEYSHLPKHHITNILQKNPKESLNITRRGAGLSIMFHKLVTSDNRRDRPLLHFALQLLLDLLNDCPEASNIESEKNDSPCATHLHFLRALVADKEVHTQLTPYMERICLTCFRYLTSEVWTIRNASLQLFGAIVPRLVGQSSGDTSLDYGTGYSINHFITHCPTLAVYLMRQLETFRYAFENFSSALYRHSSIVPILILLSKFSYTECNFVDSWSNSFVTNAKDLLYAIFVNPIYYVRSLAAKAYAAFTPFLRIAREIQYIQADISFDASPNKIHGQLLAVKYLKEKLALESKRVGMNKPLSECQVKLSLRSHNFRESCYIVRNLLLELSDSTAETTEDMLRLAETGAESLRQKYRPGFFQFIELSMKRYAEYMKHTNSINMETVDKILHSSCRDESAAFFEHLSHSATIVRNALELVLSMHNNCEILYQTAMINFVIRSLQRSLSSEDEQTLRNMEDIIGRIELDEVQRSQHTKLWYLKCVLILLFSNNQAFVHDLLLDVLNISIQEEEHLREIALGLLEFALYRFTKFSTTNKLLTIYASLILLKDEISEIREKIAGNLRLYVLPKFQTKYSSILHEEVIYQKLLFEGMSGSAWSLCEHQRENLHFIKLFTSNIRSFEPKVTIENPFYHDDSTFYKEESKFLDTCYFLLETSKEGSSNLIPSSESSGANWLSIIKTKYQLEAKAAIDFTDLLAILNTKYTDYLLRKLGIVLLEYGL